MAEQPRAAPQRSDTDVLLRVNGLTVEFPAGRGQKVHAVSEVSFDIAAGETLGLVGESGCGKSSVARALLQAPPPTSGQVSFAGTDLTELRGDRLRQQRRKLQLIYQDPISSLNARRRIADIVAEPIDIWGLCSGEQRQRTVREALSAVGLDYDDVARRRPHELSGGQCQRVNVARALILSPQLLICDEPVSALDVSVQAQILNLLEDTKDKLGLSMLFISHDLAVVKNISDRVAVIYLGRLCEVGPADAVFTRPAHHYTSALVASMPAARRGEIAPTESVTGDSTERLAGELPSPVRPPSGCRFRTRCPRAESKCAEVVPELREVGDRWVACHFPLEGGAPDGVAATGPHRRDAADESV